MFFFLIDPFILFLFEIDLIVGLMQDSHRVSKTFRAALFISQRKKKINQGNRGEERGEKRKIKRRRIGSKSHIGALSLPCATSRESPQ